MTSSYYTPLLHPDVGTQSNPGAAASYSNQLYYIGNGQEPGIFVLTRNLDSVDVAEDPDKEKTYWSQTLLHESSGFQSPIKYYASTRAQPACAVAGEDLYFVWIENEEHSHQPSGSVWATRLTAVEGNGSGADASSGPQLSWSVPTRLCNASGTPLSMPQVQNSEGDWVPQTDFSVTAWGDYLIACFKGSDAFWLLVYDPSDFPSGKPPTSWQACSQWGNEPSVFGSSLPANADLGGRISMDWFSAPALYLIISFFNETKNEAYVVHLMDVTPPGQWTSAQPFEKWLVEPCWANVTRGVNVIRDPAGRVRAYHADQNHDINVRILATNQVSKETGYCWTTFGQPALLYGQQQPTDQTPVPAFVLGSQQTGNFKLVPKQQAQPANYREVNEFVLFKNDGIKLRFSYFGDAVQFPIAPTAIPANTKTLNLNEPLSQGGALKPGAKAEYVVSGIIDSPLPLPAANFNGQSSTSPPGQVVYGSVESEGDKRETTWSWSAGFISEGYASAGMTAAWQISFNAGMAGQFGSSDLSQTATALTFSTDADLPPQGAFFYTGVIFNFQEYRFYDVDPETGQVSTDSATNAPIIIHTSINYTNITPDTVQSYANTAGNLWSYTKAGWNARMRQLGYSGDNYFDDVILAKDESGYVNAVLLDPPNPYLEFSWTPTTDVNQKPNSVSTTFEESGWHMDAKFYYGYSFALGADWCGVGEDQFGELLVGGSYSRSTVAETTESKSWSITVTYAPPGPSSSPYPGQVSKVDWRLYLLKANTQWTEELIEYSNPDLKDQLDPNSKPWRIVFEVEEDSVTFQGDNRNLVYRDQSGQIIEAWCYPDPDPGSKPFWGWTNLTQEAVAFDGSTATLPDAAGEPCWFAWGMSPPGSAVYKQAVVFRAAKNGDIYFVWSESYDGSVGKWPKIAWTWRNLGKTENFVQAAGDPVGYYWEKNPWPRGPSISVIYRGVDGDLHELWVWAEQMDGAWTAVNVTGSLPAEEKPASDPCALVWNEDPGGPSEHIYYRAQNNQIYEMYYDRDTSGWTQTAVSALSHAQATPTGKPAAFVWSGGGTPSLRVGYRGSEGKIHELLRQDDNWQPVIDPSSVAHATAADQLAGESPICGIAWERPAAPQTIYWYYLNSSGDVCELWRGAGDAAKWGWKNLSEQASGSGRLPAVAAIVQGYVWYFDPQNGTSINLYLRAPDGQLYELRCVPTEPGSQTGDWQWTELTNYVANAAGNLLPKAASG